MLVGAAVGLALCLGAGLAAWAMTGTSSSNTGSPSSAAVGGRLASSGEKGKSTATGTSGPGSGGGGTVVTVSPPDTSTTTSTATVPPAQPPPTTIVAAPPGTLVLTQSDAGKSYAVAPGQRVQVILPGTGQQYHGWVVPQSSDTLVVAPDGVTCGAPANEFCTEFVGKSTGAARLTSTSDPPCRQDSPPCEAASEVWWVNLTVS